VTRLARAAPATTDLVKLTYAQLTATHPDLDLGYIRSLRALTEGGRKLFGDAKTLETLFPRHTDEPPTTYEERKRRAFYIPYPGEVVGELVSLLAQDPLVIDAEPKPAPFYTEVFVNDVDRQGLDLTAWAQGRAREALIAGRAWSLVDFPKRPEEVRVETAADEERLGLTRAYLVPLDTECVPDWETDDHGELLWACVSSRAVVRDNPGTSRKNVRERFTFYDHTEWQRYEVVYDPDKPPAPEDTFAPTLRGEHSFGCVPLLRLDLPTGLWALDKIASIARAFLNQRSACSWAQMKHLFPLLVAYLGPEAGGGGEIPADVQTNPARATAQTYGVGRIHTFGKDDKLSYTAPPSDVFNVALEDLRFLRDEIFRVTHTMAAAVESSSAVAVGRSGDSKRQDRVSKEIIAGELGKKLRDHAGDVLRAVEAGRREAPRRWSVRGFARFDQVTANEAAEQGQVVESLAIPSPTFWRIYRGSMAERLLRFDATPEQMAQIRKEIEANTPAEDYDPANRTNGKGGKGEEDGTGDEGNERPSVPPAAPPGGDEGEDG